MAIEPEQLLRLFCRQMKARILAPTQASLRRMAAVLRRGGLVAAPTETVYGLAANALDARACRKIFQVKRRPANDPLIVHVPDLASAEKLAVWSDAARKVAKRFWPGPLTIVLPKRRVVPGIVTSGGDTVALRCPAHPVMRRLLKLAGVPLAAPSANPFGYVSPTTAAHVADGLGDRIEWILDGGPCPVGVESTIVDLQDPGRPQILRPGAVTARQLQAVIGGRRLPQARQSKGAEPLAPVMMARHYSPRTLLRIVSAARLRRLHITRPAGTALVFFRKPLGATGAAGAEYWLTRAGRGEEAAHSLYRVLHELDRKGYRRACVERAPASAGPLAGAINDRLRRAASRAKS